MNTKDTTQTQQAELAPNQCEKCGQCRIRLTDGTYDCGCPLDPDEYPSGSYPEGVEAAIDWGEEA